MALIERKAQGKEIVAQPSEELKPTKAPDLMAALDSLASVRGEELAGAEDGADGEEGQALDLALEELGLEVEVDFEVEVEGSSKKSGSGRRPKTAAKSRS